MINIKITTRFSLLAAILVLLTAGTVGYFIYTNSKASLIDYQLKYLVGRLEDNKTGIVSRISDLSEDVLFLSSMPVIDGMVSTHKQGKSVKDKSRAGLSKIFTELLERKKEYYQVSFILIDEKGTDLVMAERVNDRISVINKYSLEKEFRNDFYRNALSLKADEVAYSELELEQQIDGAKGRKLNRPLLQVAVPVQMQREKAAALLIIKMDMSDAFFQFIDGVSKGSLLFVFNNKGDFIFQPEGDADIVSEVGEGFRLEDLYSVFSDDLGENDAQWRIDLKENNYARVNDKIVQCHQIAYDPLNPDRFLGFLLSTPYENFALYTDQMRKQSIFVVAVLFALSALIGIAFSRYITQSLLQLTMAAKEYSKRNYDAPLPAGKTDEIGELASAMGTMITEIRSRDERLRTARDNLEDQINERTIELKESERRLELAWKGAGDGMWDWNIESNEVVFSSQFKKMLGYKEDELFEGMKEWEDRIHESDKGMALQALRWHLDDRAFFDVEHRLKTKSGNWRWYRIKGQAVWHENGSPMRMAGSLSDISELKLTSEKLQTYVSDMELKNLELEYAKNQAELANIAKSEFLASMSHEIRTPMNGVIGMSELLINDELSNNQRSRAESVLSSAEALMAIINDVLDFSKIESGKLEIEEVSFNLRHVVEDVVELFGAGANEKELDLMVQYDSDVPDFVIGDSIRIRQVLNNFLSNALKFTNSGYVHLHVKLEQEVKSPNGKQLICFAVKDTGVGIDNNKLGMIFDKFSQADSSITRKYGGTGLGLAISQQLSCLMGGEIGVSSEYNTGNGSTFWFTAAVALDKRKGPLFDLDTLKGLRVLILSGSAATANILKEQLLSWNLEVALADSITSVKSILKDEVFDTVIIDGFSPDEDVLSVGQYLKDTPKFQDSRVIYLSRLPDDKLIEKMETAGFSACLSKPLLTTDLFEVLNAMLAMVKDNVRAPLLAQGDLTHGTDGSQEIDSMKVLFKDVEVLLVEDNRVNQLLAEQMLKGLGCDVVSVENGKDAVDMAFKNYYDIILMDCEMPVMDGYVASKIIRDMIGNKAIAYMPVVALTANAMKGDRDKCMSAGMCDYLAKPVKKISLVEILNKWIKKEKQIMSVQVENSGSGATKKTDVNSLGDDLDAFEINKDTLMQAKNLMGERFSMLVEGYLKETNSYIEKMLLALEEEDAEILSMNSHTLKSSSAGVGLIGLSNVAKEIERRSKDLMSSDDNFDKVKSLLLLLQESFNLAKPELQNAIDTDIEKND